MAFFIFDPGEEGGPVRTTYLEGVYDPGDGSGGVRYTRRPDRLTVPSGVSVGAFFITDEFKREIEVLEGSEPIALVIPDTQELGREAEDVIANFSIEAQRIVIVDLPAADE